MFKALIHSAILFVLFLTDLAILTWCVNQLSVNNDNFKRSLISNVQAEYIPQVSVLEPNMHISNQDTLLQLPSLPAQVPSGESHVSRSHSEQQIVLRFKDDGTQLSKAEQERLEKVVQQLNINASHSVRITSGPAPAENNIAVPQTAKLRAQNVARILFPYTQLVTMQYQPSKMEVDTVMVDFSQRQVKRF